MIVASVVMAGLALTFLWLFAGFMGEPPWKLWHHLAVLLPLVLLCFSLVGWIGRIRYRAPRNLLAWAVCLALVLLQLGFHALCLFSMYGFRDFPTRQVVAGYMDQIVPIAAALPISTGLLLSILAVIAVTLGLLAAGLAWLLLSSPVIHLQRTSGKDSISWPRIAAISAASLGFLLVDPWKGLSSAGEPLVSSLHNRPLSDHSRAAQADPVEMAADWQIESAYPRNPLGTRRSVVIIYIDALRADVLQPYGGPGQMPFMTGLVRSGELRQFSKVFSSCPQTLCGMGSMLQSRPAHRVALGKFSLPMLLKRQGYQLRYLLSSDHQSFLGLKEYYGPGIDFYRDGKDMDPRHATDDLLMLSNLDRLPALAAVQTPQFILLGLMSAHIQGERHEEFRTRLPDRISPTNRDVLTTYRNNYLNGVRQADHVLQEIWAWLGKSGYLQQSIVVITADHGESLGENGVFGHARDLSAPQLHIPLWIHVPDPAWIDQPFAFQTDIAPTILDWLKLPVPSSWEGQSLLKPRDRGVSLPLFFMNRNDQFGLIYEEGSNLYKYLLDKSLHRESLFDLYADEVDAHDLIGNQSPESLAGIKERMTLQFGAKWK